MARFRQHCNVNVNINNENKNFKKSDLQVKED